MILAAALCLAFAVPATPITPESVAAVLDPVFAKCSLDGTPGASVSVVHDGKVALLKGYGVADPATGAPVDPQRHIFRAASVSKVFTATAVMQLVEQGKLDLDTDVNTYLNPPIVPEAFGKPITLRNLLQHSAGFDDEFLGMARESPENLPPLKDYFATGLPKRIFEPGHFMCYSNHGVALAGLVVEEVSGKSFAQYVDEHIFAPLGMANSHFDLVPTPETPLAVGHWRGLFGGPLERAGYDYPLTIPASTLATTSADMAHFMLAHLGEGTGNGATILKPETARYMQAHPVGGVPGMAIGFFRRMDRGKETFSHNGLIWGYASQLMLCPQENLGVYITLNSEDGSLYEEAWGKLMSTFFPNTPERFASFIGGTPKPTDLAAFAGAYRHTRYPHNSFLKFGLLASGRVREIEAVPQDDGGLSVGGRTLFPYMTDDVRTRFFPGEFKGSQIDLTSDIQLGFLDGNYQPVAIGANEPAQFYVGQATSYERIQWWEKTDFLLRVMAGCYVVLILSSIVSALRYLLRRDPGLPSGLCRALVLTVAVLLVFAIGIAGILGTLNPFAVAYGVPNGLPLLLCLPLVALCGTTASAIGLLAAIARRQARPLAALQALAVLTASVLILFTLNYWNLLGFHWA